MSERFCCYVKKVYPSVQVHCMLHRENLASPEFSEILYGVMKDVIEIVNFIKARALNSPLFEELCLSCGASHRELFFIPKPGCYPAAKFYRVLEN